MRQEREEYWNYKLGTCVMNMYLYETEIVDKFGFSITFIGSDERILTGFDCRSVETTAPIVNYLILILVC